MMDHLTTVAIRLSVAFQSWKSSERGASMVEYALLISLIALVAFAAVTLVGSALDNRYDSIAESVAAA